MDKFSCVIACYNGGPYLGECLRSVMAQDYRPIEAVIVDDCSTDNSMEVLKSMMPELSAAGVEVNLVSHTEQLGYGSSMKDGAMASTGDYIGILDADDALEPGVISHIMGLYAADKKLLYIYSQFMICDKNLKPVKIGWCRFPKRGESILACGMKGEHIFSHFKTFRRYGKMEQIFFVGCKTGCDQWMGLKLEERGRGLFTNFVGYRYRENAPGSLSLIHGTSRRAYWKKMVDRFVRNRRSRSFKKETRTFSIGFNDHTGRKIEVRVRKKKRS